MLRISDKLQLITTSFLQQGTRVITVFIMARFIGPNDNGIFALVLYAAGLVLALNDFAIPQGVVQIQEFPEEVVFDTAIVMNTLLFCLYGVCAIGAGIYLTHRDALHNPVYWRISIIYAASNLLAAIYNVQLARINRRLEFRAESQQNIIFAITTAATGIIFAVLHYGAYALALQMLAGQLAANIAIHLRVPLTWPRHASWTAAKRFLKLGTPASIAAYVRAVEAPIIGLIIRPISGTIGLGLWSKSIQIQQLFGQNILVSFQRVAYPLLVRNLNDAERLRNRCIRVIMVIMLISMLFTIIVGMNCEAIVRICLGKDWIAASPLLRITSWAIPASGLDMAAYILCMAMGLTKSLLRSSILNLCIFIPSALLIRHLGGGLIELAICWSASRYLIALATMYAAVSRLGFGLLKLSKPIARLGGAMLVSAGMMAIIQNFTKQAGLPIQFVIAGSIGTVVYVAAAWILERETIRDSLAMARGGARNNDAEAQPDIPVIQENPGDEPGILLVTPQTSINDKVDGKGTATAND